MFHSSASLYRSRSISKHVRYVTISPSSFHVVSRVYIMQNLKNHEIKTRQTEKSIGRYAGYDCSLLKVDIPENIQ